MKLSKLETIDGYTSYLIEGEGLTTLNTNNVYIMDKKEKVILDPFSISKNVIIEKGKKVTQYVIDVEDKYKKSTLCVLENKFKLGDL